MLQMVPLTRLHPYFKYSLRLGKAESFLAVIDVGRISDVIAWIFFKVSNFSRFLVSLQFDHDEKTRPHPRITRAEARIMIFLTLRSEIAGSLAISEISPVILDKIIMSFSKITGDISEIAGDPFVVARVRM
jgi:hypothetical protein